jgi:putative redox protein
MLSATVTSSTDSLKQRIFVNDRHWLETDEPEDLGGEDTAPTPLDLLPAALASCVVTTIRMFARRKGWELDEIGADVTIDREVRPAQCTIAVRLPQDLSEEQRRRLEQVAKACAVHRTLENGIAFEHADRTAAATGCR